MEGLEEPVPGPGRIVAVALGKEDDAPGFGESFMNDRRGAGHRVVIPGRYFAVRHPLDGWRHFARQPQDRPTWADAITVFAKKMATMSADMMCVVMPAPRRSGGGLLFAAVPKHHGALKSL